MSIVHTTKYILSLFDIYLYTLLTTTFHHNATIVGMTKTFCDSFFLQKNNFLLSGSLLERKYYGSHEIDFKYIFLIGPYKCTSHCHFHWMKSHGHLLDFYLFYCPFVLREAVPLIQSLPSQGRPCSHSTRPTLSYNVLYLQQLVFHRAKKEQLPNNYWEMVK